MRDARDYILQGPMDSYARNGFGLYAACLRDGTPIGICGLVKREGLNDPDVGFAFLSRYWSSGYAVESAAAVLAHARDTLRIKRVVAITSPDNWSSIAVLEKIGLRFERMIRLVDHSPELKLFGIPGIVLKYFRGDLYASLPASLHCQRFCPSRRRCAAVH